MQKSKICEGDCMNLYLSPCIFCVKKLEIQWKINCRQKHTNFHFQYLELTHHSAENFKFTFIFNFHAPLKEKYYLYFLIQKNEV